MTNLNTILSNEKNNLNNIYIYDCDGSWYAYEQSAFLFSQIFEENEIERTTEFVCVNVGKELKFLQHQLISSVDIESVDNNQITIKCHTSSEGFEMWRKQQFS
ncbi:MAG: hypothetical protein RR706_08600 [Muribaculaceae bacterium]